MVVLNRVVRTLFALLLLVSITASGAIRGGFYKADLEQAVQIMMGEDPKNLDGICSGAIVDENTVITAAHCIIGDKMYVKFFDGKTGLFEVVKVGDPGMPTDYAFLKGDTRGIEPWPVSYEIPNVPENYFFVSFNPRGDVIGIVPIRIYELRVESGKFLYHFLGAPIPGDSGSVILNEKFEVVGVVYAYYPFTDIGLGAPSFFFDYSF